MQPLLLQHTHMVTLRNGAVFSALRLYARRHARGSALYIYGCAGCIINMRSDTRARVRFSLSGSTREFSRLTSLFPSGENARGLVSGGEMMGWVGYRVDGWECGSLYVRAFCVGCDSCDNKSLLVVLVGRGWFVAIFHATVRRVKGLRLVPNLEPFWVFWMVEFRGDFSWVWHRCLISFREFFTRIFSNDRLKWWVGSRVYRYAISTSSNNI